MSVLSSLTRKNLLLNKSRTVMTIVGILLSTALITVVSTMVTSAQQTLIAQQIRFTGDYHIELRGDFDNDDLQILNANRDIKDTFVCDRIGVSQIDNPRSRYTRYIDIWEFSENAFTDCYSVELAEGRLPRSTNEIMLPYYYNTSTRQDIKIGDTVTLPIGSLWEKRIADTYDLPKQAEAVMPYSYQVYGSIGDNDEIAFVPEFSKSYQVVGFYQDIPAHTPDGDYSLTVYTLADLSENTQRSVTCQEKEFLLKLHHIQKYPDVVSQLTGLSREETEKFLSWDYDDAEGLRYRETMQSSPIGIEQCTTNERLILVSEGAFPVKNLEMNAMYNIALIIISIVIVSGIFIIGNTFAISIASKTRLYGMMSSVGATPRQIRNNVFYEAFLLGIIGIPLGVGLGVGVSAVLVWILNALLSGNHEEVGYLYFVFGVQISGIITAVLLSAVTILFSALSAARRAAKITPIASIRGNKEVKIHNRLSDRSYKTPRLIGKLFGVGGSIAWKNLRRSRRQYRTTVVSLVVSISVFIAISSFVSSAMRYTSNNLGVYGEYNMHLGFTGGEMDYEQDNFDTIAGLDGISQSVYEFTSDSLYQFQFDKNQLTYDAVTYDSDLFGSADSIKNQDTLSGIMRFTAFDNSTYRQFIKALGYEYNEVKDKGILCNMTTVGTGGRYDEEDGEIYYDDYNHRPFLKNVKGTVLKGQSVIDEADLPDKRYQTIEVELAGDFDLDAYYDNSDMPDEIHATSAADEGMIVVSMEWFKAHIPSTFYSGHMELNAKDSLKLEEQISDMNLPELYVYNFSHRAIQVQNLLIAVQIFVYGFIAVVTLIGITNVFNTVSTNMRLRAGELAMLRSVGMTNREFNRMARLESLFYAAKSLIIGIPIGVFLGFVIDFQFFLDSSYNISFRFPLFGVLVSIIAVIGIVWLIMQVSVARVRKQNIIETIRRENI